MFGNFYKSAVNLGDALWMPVGVIFALSLLWCLWRIWRDRKDPLPWCVVFCMVLFAAWRLRFHVGTGRHFLIYAIPVLFVCFTPIWDICRKSRLGYILLAAFGIACLTWSMRYDPEERKMLALYRRVRDDAGGSVKVAGLSFTKHHERERFYTGVDVTSTDRPVSAEVVLKQLDSNLRVWDGDKDAVYIFVTLPRGMEVPGKWLANNSRTGKVTVLGEAWYDRKHKKRLVVLKYVPGPVADAERIGELLPNGDFRALLSEADNQKNIRRLGRRAKRFLQPGVILPQKWGIYHSLTIKSNAVATVVECGDGQALRMEANGGYLAAISPSFRAQSKRKIHFEVYAKNTATLQLTRSIKFKKGEDMYPIITLRLNPNTRRRYTITLSPFDGDIQSGIWFWLQEGVIELSDIRLQ